MQNQARDSAAGLSKTGFITYQASAAIATITLNRGEKATAQTLDVQGFDAAVQSVLEIPRAGTATRSANPVFRS